MISPNLILASSSTYRRALLERLRIPFESVSPDIDETPVADEDARSLSLRLAEQKARAVARQYPDAVVIGSDQVPSLDGELLEKPGTAARAEAQLARCSARSVVFHTGLCVLSPATAPQLDCITVEVRFRELSAAEITNYVALDQPLDCAGSFKWESLGITLFESLEGPDPTALEGLPLIALSRMLRASGLDPLAQGSG